MPTRNVRILWKSRPDRRGVSEVVGTVMLLLMTVSVFSGIILFVNSLTGPGDRTFVDLVPGIERNNPSNGVVTITHAGGEALLENEITIVIMVNGTRYPPVGSGFLISDGLTPVDGRWVTGQRWSMPFGGTTLSQNATVQVSVIDLSRNELIMLAVVQRGIGEGGAFPIIGLGIVIPSGLVLNTGADLYRLRVIAVDYDADLPRNGVRVDLSPLGCNMSVVTLNDTGFGVFESGWSTISSCVQARDYRVNITATDIAGHTSRATMLIRVRSPASPFISGSGPFGWTFNNQFQAYEIYNATEWDAKRFNGTATRDFVKGETVVIVVASQFIKNPDLQNDLFVLGSTTLPVQPIVYGGGAAGTATAPSSRAAFRFEEFIAGYFLYTARFGTDSAAYGYNGSELAYGRYTLDMTLRANNVAPPLNRFATADSINVTDPNGNMPAYPRFEFFKDPGYTIPSSFYSFTETVFVRITVMDTNAGATFGVLTITDYLGGLQIRANPGNGPVTAAQVKNATVYAFSIDLSNPNGDPWKYGTNAYGIALAQLIDDNEKYALSSQIVVTGPKWALDVISAMNRFEHPLFEDMKVYGLFYQNDAGWLPTFVESFRTALFSGGGDDATKFGGKAFWDTQFADLDGDDDLDVVFGADSGWVLAYRNLDGQGQMWERFQIDWLGAKVLSVAAGRIDVDLYNDVVAGTDKGDIWYYNNDGSWIPLACNKKKPERQCQNFQLARSPPVLLASTGSAVNDLKLADVNGDGVNDLVAALSNNQIRAFINDGFGTFGSSQTANYVLAADSAVQGTVANTYTATLTSNDVYESVTEVNGTGILNEYYQPVGEVMSTFGQIETGSFANTFYLDGAPYQVLAETFTNSGNRWLMRNSTSGSSPGHQWSFGSIPSVVGTDTAYVTIGAFLSTGSEPMAVRYKVGNGAVSSVLGTFTDGNFTAKTFPLTGFTGGQLYIVLEDTDSSNNDQNTDGKQTKVSVDLVQVQVQRTSGTTSRMEHKWQTSLIGSGGGAYRLFTEAHHTANTESDDFLVQWGPSSTGPWSDLFVVSATADANTTQNSILPTSVGGTQIWIRVTDTNRTPNATALDTLVVDNIFVRRYIAVPNVQTISTSGPVKEVVLGDLNRDGRNDIAATIGNGAVIYYGPSWGTSSTLTTPQPSFSIDIGHIDSNGWLDVVIGCNEQFVYVFYNNATVYNRTTFVDLSPIRNTVATHIRVGDIDGDGFDDIIVGTKDGDVLWYRHLGGAGWDFTLIDNLSKTINSLDIGDVDRGVVFEYSGRLV